MNNRGFKFCLLLSFCLLIGCDLATDPSSKPATNSQNNPNPTPNPEPKPILKCAIKLQNESETSLKFELDSAYTNSNVMGMPKKNYYIRGIRTFKLISDFPGGRRFTVIDSGTRIDEIIPYPFDSSTTSIDTISYRHEDTLAISTIQFNTFDSLASSIFNQNPYPPLLVDGCLEDTVASSSRIIGYFGQKKENNLVTVGDTVKISLGFAGRTSSRSGEDSKAIFRRNGNLIYWQYSYSWGNMGGSGGYVLKLTRITN